MQLKILLPSQIFLEVQDLTSIVVGWFGLLPRRLDCVAALGPGILAYSRAGAPEAYVAIDEGLLLKTGPQVQVCVRRAIGGVDLGQLRAAVDREFLDLDERSKTLSSASAQLETGFLNTLARFRRP